MGNIEKRGLLIAALFFILFFSMNVLAELFTVIYFRDCDFFVVRSRERMNIYCIFEFLKGKYPWESREIFFDLKKNMKVFVGYYSDNCSVKAYLVNCGNLNEIYDDYIELCRRN